MEWRWLKLKLLSLSSIVSRPPMNTHPHIILVVDLVEFRVLKYFKIFYALRTVNTEEMGLLEDGLTLSVFKIAEHTSILSIKLFKLSMDPLLKSDMIYSRKIETLCFVSGFFS